MKRLILIIALIAAVLLLLSGLCYFFVTSSTDSTYLEKYYKLTVPESKIKDDAATRFQEFVSLLADNKIEEAQKYFDNSIIDEDSRIGLANEYKQIIFQKSGDKVQIFDSQYSYTNIPSEAHIVTLNVKLFEDNKLKDGKVTMYNRTIGRPDKKFGIFSADFIK